MENSKQQSVINLIEKVLSESDRMWNEKGKSDAFIIGYLEGALKMVKRDLKSNLEAEADEYRLQEAIDENRRVAPSGVSSYIL
jgi:hypothetical protein